MEHLEKVQNLVSGYWGLEEEVRQIQRQMDSARQELIDLLSPVKIGDIITVNGYSHKGKKMRVDVLRCYLNTWDKAHISIEAYGNVLNKDGLPGLNKATSYYRFDSTR